MRSKQLFLVAGLIVVLLGLVVGAYAYDSGREGLIAEGLTVGGVDVGGMRTDEAEQAVRAQLLQPLNRPVVAEYKGRRFTLTPKTSRVSVDVESTVDSALQRSREGNMLGRALRGLTGGEIEEDIPVSISYDRDGVSRMVRRVRDRLEREPVDAQVALEDGTVEPRRARTGLEVDIRSLRRAVVRQLTTVNGTKEVRVPAEVVKPKVTTKELASRYPSIVVVNRNAFSLQLFKRLKQARTYRIAVGQAGLETPAGRYTIQNMAVNPAWHVPNSDWAGDLAGTVVPPGPSNPIKSRWLGIYNGAGIHGTDAIYSLGTAASHGCIRMAIPDVEELYEQVDVGTPVYII